VLAAVPDAAASGLLDVPPDRAELMTRQAASFGQAGLARAAEIVSTGLDQMRGATSPRLLLELTCAQVLLPAAATDEKSLLARLERLEKGTPPVPRQVPHSPSPAPQSAPDHGAERARVSSPSAQSTPEPAEPARPAPQASRPAPQASRPAPQASRPAPEPEPVRPNLAPAAPAPPAPKQAAGGSTTADSLRHDWDAILEAVKQERRVAWMVLSDASVLSLEDGVLTLRFPRDGNVKGFSASGHDTVLKRVLSDRFGLNVTIKGVAGGAAGPASPAGEAQPGNRPPACGAA
jgi:DNA polymerase III subunit gamma/tau